MDLFSDAPEPSIAIRSGTLPCGCALMSCPVARRLGAIAPDLIRAANVVAGAPDDPLAADLSVPCSRAAAGLCHLTAIFHIDGLVLTGRSPVPPTGTMH